MILYGGVPINEIDFEKEFDKELEPLKQTIQEQGPVSLD